MCLLELVLVLSGFDLDIHHWKLSSDVWDICHVTLVVGGGWLLWCGGLNMVMDPTQGIFDDGGRLRCESKREDPEI